MKKNIKQKTLIVDLDYTLLNTRALKSAFFYAVKPYVSRKLFNNTYKQIMRDYAHGYNYTTQAHAKLLSEYSGQEFEKLSKLLNDALAKAKIYLYADAISFLKKINKLPLKKILITFANQSFQKDKLKALKITQYFDKVLIVSQHKHKAKLPIEKDGAGAIFINDNVMECLDLQKKYPCAIFLVIPRHKKYKTLKHNFRSFKSLLPVASVIKKTAL